MNSNSCIHQARLGSKSQKGCDPPATPDLYPGSSDGTVLWEGHPDITLGKNRRLLSLLTIVLGMWATISSREWWQLRFWTAGQVKWPMLSIAMTCGAFTRSPMLVMVGQAVPCHPESGSAHLIEWSRIFALCPHRWPSCPCSLAAYETLSSLGLEIGASLWSSLKSLGRLLYLPPREGEKMLTIAPQLSLIMTPWEAAGREEKEWELSSGLPGWGRSARVGVARDEDCEAHPGQARWPSDGRRQVGVRRWGEGMMWQAHSTNSRIPYSMASFLTR